MNNSLDLNLQSLPVHPLLSALGEVQRQSPGKATIFALSWLAITGEWDPNARIDDATGSNSTPLELMALHLHSDSKTKEVASGNALALEQVLAQSPACAQNIDWLLAYALEKGGNPWRGFRKNSEGEWQFDRMEPSALGLPPVVLAVIKAGHLGLFERLMAHPEAWSPREVLAAGWQRLDRSPSQNPTTVRQQLIRSHGNYYRSEEKDERAAAMLEWLLERAPVQSWTSEDTESWAQASFAAVRVLSKLQQLPAEKAQARAVKAWEERFRRGELEESECLEMVSLLPAIQSPGEGDARRMRIEKFILGGWPQEFNGSSGSAYDYELDIGVAALLERCDWKKGSSVAKGQWNGLAARAYQRLRGAKYDGVPAWDVRQMVGKDAWAPGCLKEALGFEWRPGIRIEGLLSLSLLGHRKENSSTECISNFAEAIGVPDALQWANTFVQDALGFSIAQCESRSAPAMYGLALAWTSALETHPGWAVQGSDESWSTLLVRLTEAAAPMEKFRKALCDRLGIEAKKLLRSSPALAATPAQQVLWVLAVAFEQQIDKSQQSMSVSVSLPGETRVKEFEQCMRKNWEAFFPEALEALVVVSGGVRALKGFSEEAKLRAEAARMDQRLPSASSGPRPRF